MKRLFALVLCLTLLVSMAGCENDTQDNHSEEINSTEEPILTKDPAAGEPSLSADSITEEPTSQVNWYLTQLTDDCAASVELPNFIMEDEALKQLVIDYIDTFLDESFDSVFSLTLSNTDLTVEPSDCLYYLDLSCRVTYEHEDFVSLVFEGLYNMKTAAHPINLLFSLNISRYTNERVMFKDIWPVDDVFYNIYRSYAQAALTAKLDENVSIDAFCTKDALLNGLQTEKEYCVYCTQTGIVISIPVIHALGDHFETEIPYKELQWNAMPYEMLTEMKAGTSLFDGRFVVIEKGRNSWIRFFDLNGDLLVEDLSARGVHIVQPNDRIAGYWIQGGTGPSTRWSYFYDGTSGALSKEFTWFLDVTSDKVVCGNINGVTVYSIFDDSYNYEITTFEYPLPKLGVESVINAKFSEDGKSVIVEYYKNNDFEKATQTFELP